MIARLRHPCLWSDRRGLAAWEFALVAPVMVLAWWGLAQFYQVAQASFRTNLVAQSLSEMVSCNNPSVAPFQLSDLVSAATQIISPLPVSTESGAANGSLTVDVADVSFDGNGQNPSTAWRCTQGQNADTSPPLTLASNLGAPNATVIMVTVKYSYEPTLPGNVIGAQNFVTHAFSSPRWSTAISSPCSN